MLYIVINVFIGGLLENQLVEGQPSLKELNEVYIYKVNVQWIPLTHVKLHFLYFSGRGALYD